MRPELQTLLSSLSASTHRDMAVAVRQSAHARPEFAWYAEMTRMSTREDIAQRLQRLFVRDLVGDPGLYEDHFDIASAAIDRCIARSREIHEIESAALATVVGYLLEEQLQPGALALARTQLKAWRAQGQAGPGDADEKTLLEQDATQTAMRAMRQSFHTVDGHALNFAQRLNFLRELQARDACTALERLRCARLGIAAGLGIEMPPVPDWRTDGADPFEALVAWCRNTMRAVEAVRRTETIRFYALRLNDTGPRSLLGAIARDEVDARGFHHGVFELTAAALDLKPNERARILDIGFGVQFIDSTSGQLLNVVNNTYPLQDFSTYLDLVRDWRNRFVFTAELDPPAQWFGDEHRPDGRFWRREPLTLRDGVGPVTALDEAHAPLRRESCAINANPLGQWVVRLHRDCRNGDAWSERVRGLFRERQSEDRKKINKFQLLDPACPVLFLRLSVHRG
ncbi:MAG: hypothetical protein E6Q50_04965 [Lysobacter sp.]|nr:MAG: hypothetical protein E6Q50_04965 [Lysobacter sp.]